MSSTSQGFLQIDEEGFLLSGEMRLNDFEFGQAILKALHVTESFTIKSTYQEQSLYIEAFDEPYVAQSVRLTDRQMFIKIPYDLEFEVKPETLCLDEWDRFHGLTTTGVPFVFMNKAQADFFNQLDEYDDDSITLFGKTYTLPSYFPDREDIDPAEYWSDIYRAEENPGWNLNAPANALIDMLPRLKLPKSNVLVLGCGEGHDAAHFAEAGHLVTAVDISEEALSRAKKKYVHLTNITWVQADLFDLPMEWNHRFDLIFEYTCFCAINPARRNEMVKVWGRLLHEQGQLMGVFFTMPKRIGPPFGASEWELRKRLTSGFQFLFWGRWKKSIERRQGKELFVLAKKRAR